MKLAFLEDGLFTDNTFSFHLPVVAGGIEDMPMPFQELNGTGSMIFDGDAVGEDILVSQRPRIFDLEECFYGYFYVTRD